MYGGNWFISTTSKGIGKRVCGGQSVFFQGCDVQVRNITFTHILLERIGSLAAREALKCIS